MIRAPSMQDLSVHLARAARAVAERVQRAGHRAWIVGGAPRDLALGRDPQDVDLASAATPPEIERLFPETIPVGKVFGTVVIRVEGLDVQHTTFRSESGYSDARRPDAVGFGATVEEDASRRDFTCNAVYLDPLADRCLDPQQGLADLAAGTLRAVGEPRLRFREDGLRLLRMARFAAGLDLELAPGLADAARESADALRGVSAERVLVELSAMMERPGSARAITILVGCDLLERVLPGWSANVPAGATSREWIHMRLRALAALPSPPGTALGLAVLLAPTSVLTGEESGPGDVDRALALADRLRVSRALRKHLIEIWQVARALARADAGMPKSRAERIRLLRQAAFSSGADLARAWSTARGTSNPAIAALCSERERLGEVGLREPAWIVSGDLAALHVAPGPQWGSLLEEAERLQLDGVWRTREEALAWLSARVQDGGKTPRSQ